MTPAEKVTASTLSSHATRGNIQIRFTEVDFVPLIEALSPDPAPGG